MVVGACQESSSTPPYFLGRQNFSPWPMCNPEQSDETIPLNHTTAQARMLWPHPNDSKCKDPMTYIWFSVGWCPPPVFSFGVQTSGEYISTMFGCI